MAMQQSFEGRMIDDEEDQVVAYSAKRKNHKAAKNMAKKSNTSPKHSAFFNNSTIGEMSNVW